MSDNNDFTHEFVVYNSDNNNGTQGTGKFLLYDDNINALKVEDISNLQIGGGENGQVLMTDGEGNLTWATSSGGGTTVNADWNSSSGASRILNKPDLSVYLPKSGGTLTGKLNAAQGAGTTGGYSFGGTEGSNDTGMFSNADGVLDFYANAVKIVTVTTGGVTSTQAITLPGNPTSNLQAATKQYVDSSVGALNNFNGDYNNLTNKPTVATSAYIGTTQVAFNRASGALTLAGVSIDGNAATVSNGVYTNGSYANPAWITSLAYSKLTDAPSLAAVATSGSYADLTSKPTLATVATSGSYSDLTNRPTIFSGSYADLTNKPTLFDGAYLSLTGRPNLAAVATSGSYNDLINKPSIPDLTGYATEAWVNSQGFGSGSGFSGAYADLTGKPTLFSGSYNDLTNKPSIPAAQVNADWNETISESPAYIFNKPTIPDLTGYATEAWVNSQGFGSGSGSGVTSYNDLTDKPFIPTSFSDLGITAGSDGQILTLNSSLVPVWTTPTTSTPTMISSGNTAPGSAVVANETNVSVNFSDGGSGKFVFKANGQLQLASGGDIVDSTGASVLGGSSGPTNEITNTDGISTYSVSVGTDGVVTMNTVRGTIEFGAMPEVGGPNHFHIMKPESTTGVNLYFGDDYNYVLQRGTAYGDDPAYGVEIGTNDRDGGAQHVWRFDTNGKLTLPQGMDISQSIKWTYYGSEIFEDGGLNIESRNSGIAFYSSTDSVFTVGGDKQWRFKTNGDLTLPAGGDIKDINGNSVLGSGSGGSGDFMFEGNTITSPNANDDVEIYGGQSNGDYTGINLISREYAQLNYSSTGIPNANEGKNNYVWVDQDGVTIQIWADPGNGDYNFNWVFNNNGSLTFPSLGGGSDVGVNGDDEFEISTPGDIVLHNTSGSWTFSNGDLKLPSGGDIKDSNGNSVLGGGTPSKIEYGLSEVIIPTEDGPILINAADEKVWQFQPSGELMFPDGSIQTTAFTGSGGGGTSGFTSARVAGQDDVLASESGNVLELVAGEGIALTTNTNDGTITISAASNASPQYGYFTELSNTADSNRVNGEAVAMDSDGNSYVSYSYYSDNDDRYYGGVAKFSGTGTKLWNVDISSQNGDAQYPEICSLEYSTLNGSPVLIAFGNYYDNNTSKDVAIMYAINPETGAVGVPLLDAEITSDFGMELKDGVVGVDGNNDPFAVVVGSTYDQKLTKTLTPLAGSTTDKVYFSWSDVNAAGLQNNDQLIYNVGGYAGLRVNAVETTANPAGSTDPSWAGLSLTISATESGSYVITRVNGWGWAMNGWSVPQTLTVLGSVLGGVDGVNDMTFDFDRTVFDNNSNNINAAVSNIQGTPISTVYCQAWNNKDWSTEIGNPLTFDYNLNNQAFIARFGSNAWTKNVGTSDYDRLNSVAVDSDGNVYAAGYAWNNSRGSLVAKYDIDGNKQWAVYIDPSNNTGNELTSIDLLTSGDVITTDEDGTVTKLNKTDGSIIWQVTVENGPSWDANFRGTATPDGDYIISNYEDNDYTLYVMRVSGSDGSSMWTKRITRTYGGSDGEINVEDDFDAQFIDCNDTYVTIAANSQPNSGNETGLVISFPINGENVNGTYGQYVVTSESLDWTTESTGSITATLTETPTNVTVNELSPSKTDSTFTVNKTNIGGEEVVAAEVISWTNPNNNTWRIETYNGGAAVQYWSGDDYSAKWFDIADHTSGSSDFRGAIIQYHAFIQNRGTIIGTIHLTNDYTQEEATHTEHLSGGSDLQFVTLWKCNNERGQLFFKMTNEQNWQAMIQWTSTVFYGQESND